jgi:hypothetical protein
MKTTKGNQEAATTNRKTNPFDLPVIDLQIEKRLLYYPEGKAKAKICTNMFMAILSGLPYKSALSNTAKKVNLTVEKTELLWKEIKIHFKHMGLNIFGL